MMVTSVVASQKVVNKKIVDINALKVDIASSLSLDLSLNPYDDTGTIGAVNYIYVVNHQAKAKIPGVLHFKKVSATVNFKDMTDTRKIALDTGTTSDTGTIGAVNYIYVVNHQAKAKIPGVLHFKKVSATVNFKDMTDTRKIALDTGTTGSSSIS